MRVLGRYDPQDREGWLRMRLSGLGGSDAAAIMGADDWRGPFDVWNDRVNPEDIGRSGGEAAYWGTVLEKIVAQEFAERKTLEWGTRVGIAEEPVVYQHATRDYMLATVDRFVYMDYHAAPEGILEVKTRSGFVNAEWSVGVPLKVWWQVQHYLSVTGLRQGWVAVLLGGQKYMDFPVPRDDEAITRLELACARLWSQVQSGQAPPLDGSKAQRDMLEAAHPEGVSGTSIELSDAATLNDLLRYKELSGDIKRLERELLGIKTRIQSVIGGAEYLVDANGVRLAKWGTIKKSRFDARSFEEDHPDLAAPYMLESTYRTLSVKGAAE